MLSFWALKIGLLSYVGTTIKTGLLSIKQNVCRSLATYFKLSVQLWQFLMDANQIYAVFWRNKNGCVCDYNVLMLVCNTKYGTFHWFDLIYSMLSKVKKYWYNVFAITSSRFIENKNSLIGGQKRWVVDSHLDDTKLFVKNIHGCSASLK